MCGICGFAGLGDAADIRAMNAAQAHRGPDGEGLFEDPGLAVFFGHKRLSILDIAGGAQPMATSDGRLAVTFNGEIYNYRELRDELTALGHRFVSDHSDTEVLLHGYRQWGQRLSARLNGMWAFALLDRDRRRLFLSRDRFAKKPLFYTAGKNLFAFASELQSLAAHREVNPGVSARALRKYFAYGFIPAPNSLYENVFKLPGGHNLTLDLADLAFKLSRYHEFRLEPFESLPADPEAEWGQRLRELLERAVARRLMSDVPLGVFLSGGVDSSAITAYAAKHAPGRLATFSIGFSEPSFDESAYAQKIASLFQTDHHNTVFSLDAGRLILPAIAAGLDEPMGDSSILPTYLLCRQTRERVTVALGGDGADELFAGYDPFRALAIAETYRKLCPAPVHKALLLLAARLPVSHANMALGFKINRFLRGAATPPRYRDPVWLGPLGPDGPGGLDELFGSKIDPEDLYCEAIDVYERCQEENPVDKTLAFYANIYLQDDIMVKSDRAGMLNSLEVRAPFLDIELVDFVRRIPSNYKFRGGQTKYILKKALADVLPHDILHRPKKGFGMPIGKWLEDGALHFPETAAYGLNSKFIQARLHEHQTRQADHRALLWNYWLLRATRG
ncbi:MAG: asparagine synthase (glutamine-hydrolyzing) [Desulfovibrionaceae bacterium]|nr:asparagine synthase (glutamine-hydrolyzing) [Desulfovibrionaceae bacterium]MBF0514591.1 asparagine synthase (glutamine-hydrolyzing) [Desulfovibrionaceae bacterium]